jgi:hypothetical protein
MKRLLALLAVLLFAQVAVADDEETSEVLLSRGLRDAWAGNCDDAVKDLLAYQLTVKTVAPEALQALRKCEPPFRWDALGPLEDLLIGHWEVSGRRANPFDVRLKKPFQKAMSCVKRPEKIVCQDSASLDAFQTLSSMTVVWDLAARAYALTLSDDPQTVYRGAMSGTRFWAEYRSPSGALHRRLAWDFSDRKEVTTTISLSRDHGPFRVVEAATLSRAAAPEDVEDRRWRQFGWEKCNAKDRAGALEALSHLDAAGRAHIIWVCSRHGVTLPKDAR